MGQLNSRVQCLIQSSAVHPIHIFVFTVTAGMIPVYAYISRRQRMAVIANNPPPGFVPTFPAVVDIPFWACATTTKQTTTIWGPDRVFQLLAAPISGDWSLHPKTLHLFFEITKHLGTDLPQLTAPDKTDQNAKWILDHIGNTVAKQGKLDSNVFVPQMNFFVGLVQIAEKRSINYPFDFVRPKWYDIPLEGYAKLAGVPISAIDQFAGKKAMTWLDFINGFGTGEGVIAAFTPTLGRVFSGNSFLLNQQVRRDPNWNKIRVDLVSEQLMVNLGLVGYITPDLKKFVKIDVQ